MIDDHSRYALAFVPTTDRTMATTFSALREVFGDVGLPDAILCDNAFGSLGRPGLSAFDAKLVRLGIKPLHGRPYHPQTQGKVEAFHGSVVRELVNRHTRLERISPLRSVGILAHATNPACFGVGRMPTLRNGRYVVVKFALDDAAHFAIDCEAWRTLYNTERPHEGLNDEVPISRWRPSVRRRPAVLPEVEYQAGSVLRKVSSPGLIRLRTARVSLGHGLVGQWVRVCEDEDGVTIYYASHPVRHLRPEQLAKDCVV